MSTVPNATRDARHGIPELGLSPEDLRAVADRLFCVRYERGDTIFRQGEPAERFYVKAGPVVGMSTLMGFLAAIFFKTLE